jgi:3-deoxy-manno-octulosonate cytidylyltransferase (CMP-KDO synthetase)
MHITGVIPARYHSTRFPGKPLARIKGVPLIERVWRQAAKSRRLDDLVVATDDERIAECVRRFGGKTVETPIRCASGTDRLAAVARRSAKRSDILINIQGDEPLISPRLIDSLASALVKDPSLPAVTAAYPLSREEDVFNPNVVKVVTDKSGRALYFSRSPLPFRRAETAVPYYKHLGIYGYRRKFLLSFASWPQTPLEKTEQLEQLRIIERGFAINVIVSRYDSFGVDVPEDVVKIERLLP